MLPSPNLDDRRFQDLVDDAKRMVQRRCPEWTDHNVSDPGVTLIETVAFMTDELFYRLNRVPDRLYVAFLELLGVRLHPAGAASVDVTMWLSAPQDETVVVPEGTEAATSRSDRDDAVVFTTTTELRIPPRRLVHLLTQRPGGEPVPHDEQLGFREPFPVFTDVPQVDDVMLLGLDDSAPSCVLVLRFDSDVQGVGVDPRHPPLVWEAWDGHAWVACDVDSDGTGGLNRPGDVVLHVPPTHTASVLADRRAGWLRCRVVEPDADYPPYGASPTVREADAFTIGGTVEAVHAQTITDEVLGLSEGVHGQVFPLEHRPVVAGRPLTLDVAAGPGWDTWTEVESFAGHDEDDHVLVVDRAAGEVRLAPAVREPDGTLRAFGAVPPKGAPLRVPSYRTGGG
ncbi:putative baseplate assembly protein, partial [uncultured Cellulomonas sp.]|uniref:putative baseplate assembly protein n=1 Tax=uncultured Cellulomonas sp. TaxID=189682 RepID=UPI0028EBAC8C